MKEYTITSNDADQRLDKFLKKLFVNASRSLIYKFNRTGKIKIIDTHGKKQKKDNEYKLISWEKVQIFLSDDEILNLSQKSKTQDSIDTTNKLSPKDIVYEDDFLLVLNKNSKLNVHPWDHKTQEVSLIEQVEDYYAWKLDSLTFKPSLIHRIDRETSWIIMIAKQKQTLTKLSSDFKKHIAIEKKYFCLVIWKLSRTSWTIRKKLLRLENAKNENKVQVSDKWLEAITHYNILNEYHLNTPQWQLIVSAVEVSIETWRMHQIRVHMSHIGNPIIWDKIYWDKRLNWYFEKNFTISRQMLHAQKIKFFHPQKKKHINLEAKFKNDMQQFIDIMKN